MCVRVFACVREKERRCTLRICFFAKTNLKYYYCVDS